MNLPPSLLGSFSFLQKGVFLTLVLLTPSQKIPEKAGNIGVFQVCTTCG